MAGQLLVRKWRLFNRSLWQANCLTESMGTHRLKRAQLFQNSEGDGAGEPLLHCGETVPRSGIYEAIHHNHGASDGAIIALRSEAVRPCQTCGDRVALRLIYAAPHISEDEDFTSEPTIRN